MPAGDYAVSVAGAFEAHLTGIAFVYDPIIPVSGTGYIPAEVIETQQADNEAAAKAALDRFAAAADAPAFRPSRSRSPPASPAPATSSAASRGASISPSSARPSPKPRGGEIVAESTLFESGRPMILVPYIQKAPLKLDNVMVCWDGSRQAARAIADAMPLLVKAGRVEIVIDHQ